MAKRDFTSIFKVGDSKVMRIPSRLLKDEDYPFKEESDLVMEITKDKKGNQGLFIRKDSD